MMNRLSIVMSVLVLSLVFASLGFAVETSEARATRRMPLLKSSAISTGSLSNHANMQVPADPNGLRQLDPPDSLFGSAGTLYVDLRWWPPLTEELAYDTDAHDYIISWNGANTAWSVRFTPLQYPALVVAGRYMRVSYLGSDPTTPIRVCIWGAVSGHPGSVLTDQIEVCAPGDTTWFDVDFSSYTCIVSSTDADFFTGWYCTDSGQGIPGDITVPIDSRSWGYNGAGWYLIPNIPPGGQQDMDLAIRALVSYGFWQPLKYKVYRSENQGGPYDSIGTVNSFPYTFSFQDNNVLAQTTYWYYVTALYTGGESDPSNLVSVTTPGQGIASNNPSALINATKLGQNSPNPFSNRTCLTYSVPAPSFVELKIYDLNGRLVRTLVSLSKSSGNYSVYWDGTDDQGQPLANGAYFYRLVLAAENGRKTQGISIIKKMLIIR